MRCIGQIKCMSDDVCRLNTVYTSVCVSVSMCTIYTDAHVQRIMYMYTVQCTPYNVQCTICPNMNNARTKYFVRRTMYVVR